MGKLNGVVITTVIQASSIIYSLAHSSNVFVLFYIRRKIKYL